MLKKLVSIVLLSTTLFTLNVNAKDNSHRYEVSYPNGVNLTIETVLDIVELNNRILDCQYVESDFTDNILTTVKDEFYPVYVITKDDSKNEYILPLREISNIKEI